MATIWSRGRACPHRAGHPEAVHGHSLASGRFETGPGVFSGSVFRGNIPTELPVDTRRVGRHQGERCAVTTGLSARIGASGKSFERSDHDKGVGGHCVRRFGQDRIAQGCGGGRSHSGCLPCHAVGAEARNKAGLLLNGLEAQVRHYLRLQLFGSQQELRHHRRSGSTCSRMHPRIPRPDFRHQDGVRGINNEKGNHRPLGVSQPVQGGTAKAIRLRVGGFCAKLWLGSCTDRGQKRRGISVV